MTSRRKQTRALITVHGFSNSTHCHCVWDTHDMHEHRYIKWHMGVQPGRVRRPNAHSLNASYSTAWRAAGTGTSQFPVPGAWHSCWSAHGARQALLWVLQVCKCIEFSKALLENCHCIFQKGPSQSRCPQSHFPSRRAKTWIQTSWSQAFSWRTLLCKRRINVAPNYLKSSHSARWLSGCQVGKNHLYKVVFDPKMLSKSNESIH